MLFFFLSLSTVCSRVVTINRGAKENKLEYCEIFPVVQYMLWCANKNFKVKGVYSLFCDNHPSPHPPKKILPLPWLMHVDPVAKTDNYCHSHFCPGLPCPGKLPRPPLNSSLFLVSTLFSSAQSFSTAHSFSSAHSSQQLTPCQQLTLSH